MSQCGCESISGYRRRPENDVGASGVLCFVFNRRVVNTAARARLAANYWRKIDDEEGKPEDASQNPSGQALRPILIDGTEHHRPLGYHSFARAVEYQCEIGVFVLYPCPTS